MREAYVRVVITVDDIDSDWQLDIDLDEIPYGPELLKIIDSFIETAKQKIPSEFKKQIEDHDNLI